MWPFKKKQTETPAVSSAASAVEAAQRPAEIRVFDQFGREVSIPRESWRKDVLLPNLEQGRDNPEALYAMIIDALQNGFAADVLPFALRLHEISPDPLKGAVILGIVYLELGQLESAETALRGYLSKHGDGHAEAGVVFTNLAKVFAARGLESEVESNLWRGLELDPNQPNAFHWFLSRQNERGGDSAVTQGLSKLAALPKSWRARLAMGRAAVVKIGPGKNELGNNDLGDNDLSNNDVSNNDLSSAEALFVEAIELAGVPVPADLLMEISGELGNNGHLEKLLELVSPHFEPKVHGLAVGNNLIKANFELKRYAVAHEIVESLYALQNPSWRQALDYWEHELAKVGVAIKNRNESKPPQIISFALDAPLWARDGSPFAQLVPAKTDDATRVAIVGSSALIAKSPQNPETQLSDGPGRLSRVVPLILAEHLHLSTNGFGTVVLPWAQKRGFVLYGAQFADADLCAMQNGAEKPPQFVVGVTVDATGEEYKLLIRLVRTSDGQRLTELSLPVAPNDPGPGVERLLRGFEKILVDAVGLKLVTPPEWYKRPSGVESSDYLLRLEQQLAVLCCNVQFLEGGSLSGEREILDGVLQLALRQATNTTARILFAQTMREMKKARPNLLEEYRSKVDALQKRYPVSSPVAAMVEQALEEAFGKVH